MKTVYLPCPFCGIPGDRNGGNVKCYTCLFELDEEMWQKRVHQWKPIEELEKLVGDPVLLIEHYSEDPFVGHWDGKEWVESKHYEPMNPTHYTPLPEKLEEPK